MVSVIAVELSSRRVLPTWQSSKSSYAATLSHRCRYHPPTPTPSRPARTSSVDHRHTSALFFLSRGTALFVLPPALLRLPPRLPRLPARVIPFFGHRDRARPGIVPSPPSSFTFLYFPDQKPAHDYARRASIRAGVACFHGRARPRFHD